VAVWVVVNGPGAQHLGINAGINCLGQGAWANATLGRALHLVLQNVGGALPGEMDRATHGQPGKLTFCCAENETASPWQALHVERGFRPDATTVTVVGAEGTMNMNSHAKDADQLLDAFAQTMIHPPSNEYTHGGEPWLILGPEHAEVLHRAGMSKADVKRELWLRSRMAAGRMTDRDRARVLDSRKDEFPQLELDTLLTIAPQPEDIQLIVAGGPGTHSVYVPCFGNSRAVTVEIRSQ
ncbi:MAG: UGSC family (seleno)protein, partial [Burkholderiales bacterium]